jgi:hypothetical protein
MSKSAQQKAPRVNLGSCPYSTVSYTHNRYGIHFSSTKSQDQNMIQSHSNKQKMMINLQYLSNITSNLSYD